MYAWIDDRAWEALEMKLEDAARRLEESQFSRDMHPGYLEYHGLQAQPGEMESLDREVEQAAARVRAVRAEMARMMDKALAAYRAYEAMEH